jgi:hypothetical protein
MGGGADNGVNTPIYSSLPRFIRRRQPIPQGAKVEQRRFVPQRIRQMLAIVSFQRWGNIYLEPLHATVRANMSTQPHRHNPAIS